MSAPFSGAGPLLERTLFANPLDRLNYRNESPLAIGVGSELLGGRGLLSSQSMARHRGNTLRHIRRCQAKSQCHACPKALARLGR